MKKYLIAFVILASVATTAPSAHAQSTFDVPAGLPAVIMTPTPGAKAEVKHSKKTGKSKRKTAKKSAKKKSVVRKVAKKK